ncbi:MAG: hypothetical protein LBP63_02570 [Prevotellaceae bacterium]|jgi:TfoX/Sxy family transcriptional regulator of competence genes|nr:hypothetical protein [Prevotellaceae bacterium]
MSDLDYVQYVIDQIRTAGTVRYKKMFEEYLIYLNDKPVVYGICKVFSFWKVAFLFRADAKPPLMF